MPIALDRTSSEPLYRQVATSGRRAIDDRRFRPGQRVPSVRILAGQLGVGRRTIATAYEQLAGRANSSRAEGYLIGRVGFGTVVVPEPPEPRVPSEIERRRNPLASAPTRPISESAIGR